MDFIAENAIFNTINEGCNQFGLFIAIENRNSHKSLHFHQIAPKIESSQVFDITNVIAKCVCQLFFFAKCNDERLYLK